MRGHTHGLAAQLGMEDGAVGDVTGEGLLRRDGDPLGLQLEVARIDAAGPVAQQRADRAGQDRAQLDVAERRQIADGRRRRQRPAAPRRVGRRRAGGAPAAVPGSVARGPGGTTVMPPGLRRSDATLHTTFDVETPSEQESEVDARTAVRTASATARAPEKSGATVPRSR